MVVRGTVTATQLARRLRGRPSLIPADPTLSIVGLIETVVDRLVHRREPAGRFTPP